MPLLVRRLQSALIAAILLLQPVTAEAGMFSDVPDDNPFRGDIEALAQAGIINGYGNGTFGAGNELKRAEWMKLLYAAAKLKPKAIYSNCFPDVEKGSWYELIICDAASRERGFLQGYNDGKVRPGSPVSRVEALKTLYLVFGLPVPDVSEIDRSIVNFVDVSVSAWYTRFLSAAYVDKILPIAGIRGARFYPDKPLLRGEAAAFIFNGLAAKKRYEEAMQKPSSSSSSSSSEYGTKKVTFPFTDSDQFQGMKPISYMFDLTAFKTQVSIEAMITGAISSDITCRLYLLDGDGFTSEYYLGKQDKGKCTILVAAGRGSYQLQVQPTASNANFSVVAKGGTGDNNDGFMEAMTLIADQSFADILQPNDMADWFQFTIKSEMQATFDVTADQSVTCIIYTPKGVDQFGFSGPKCSVPYTFAAGTYIVGIVRATGIENAKRITYLVKWH